MPIVWWRGIIKVKVLRERCLNAHLKAGRPLRYLGGKSVWRRFAQ